MVLRSILYGAAVRSTHPYDQGAWVVKRPLTEEDILELHDLFLTNGIHHIKVDDLAAGRSLMHTLLTSLNCYHAMAVLTLEPLSIEPSTCDVYQELVRSNFLSDAQAIDTFFLEQFYFDFMWIEMSQDLAASEWFAEFEQKMIEYKLETHLPIVVVTYKQE